MPCEFGEAESAQGRRPAEEDAQRGTGNSVKDGGGQAAHGKLDRSAVKGSVRSQGAVEAAQGLGHGRMARGGSKLVGDVAKGAGDLAQQLSTRRGAS